MTSPASEESREIPVARRIPDRRKKPTGPLSPYFLHGRRKGNRRATDPQVNYYVDRYGFWAAMAAIGIVVLSVVDSFFTLILIGHGATEINPVMRLALRFGTYPFFFIKYFLTIASVIILLVHKNFRIGKYISIKNIILGLGLAYFVLVVYEFVLYFGL